jgi:hypothetical protein
LPVFFKEAANGRFQPRALAIDLDTRALNTFRNSPVGRLFDPNKIIDSGGNSQSCSSNFAIGHYTEGAVMID